MAFGIISIRFMYCLALITFVLGKPLLANSLGPIPLERLIAVGVDLSREKAEKLTFKELKRLLAEPTEPARIERIQNEMNILLKHQFSEGLDVRELVANALDACKNNDEGQKGLVKIVTDNQKFGVGDNGIGMSIGQLVSLLLTPRRSNQDAPSTMTDTKNQIIGQFGIGFFSTLSRLKNDNVIKILTHKKSHPSYQIALSRGNDSISVSIIELNSDDYDFGTSINIWQRTDWNFAKEMVKDYFRYVQDVDITVNGILINDPAQYEVQLIPGNIGIYTSKSKSSGKHQGRVNLLINNVLFEKFSFSGFHTFDELAINLPPEKFNITPDRQTLPREDGELLKIIHRCLEHAFKNQNFYLFNSLYNLAASPFKWKGSNVIPDIKETQSVTEIFTGHDQQKPFFVNPKAWDGSELYSRENTHKTPVVRCKFSFESGDNAVCLPYTSGSFFLDARLHFSTMTEKLLKVLSDIKQRKSNDSVVIVETQTIKPTNVTIALDSQKAEMVDAAQLKEEQLDDLRQALMLATTNEKVDVAITSTAFKILMAVAEANIDWEDGINNLKDPKWLFKKKLSSRKTCTRLKKLSRDERKLLEAIDTLKETVAIIRNFPQKNKALNFFRGQSLRERITGDSLKYLTRYRDFINSILSKVDRYKYDWTYGNYSIADIDLIENMYNYIKDFHLNNPEFLVVSLHSTWQNLFNNEAILSNDASIRNFFLFHYNRQRLINYESNGEIFFHHVISKIRDENLFVQRRNVIENLAAFHQFFSANPYFSENLKANSATVLPVMFEHLLEDGELAIALQDFLQHIQYGSWLSFREQLLSSLQRNHLEMTSENCYSEIEKKVDPKLAFWFHQIFFGDVSFFQEEAPNPGDQLRPKLQPIAQHQTVKSILGGDETLVNKEYRQAAGQNKVLENAWIRELIDNAYEAKATQIRFFVNTDQEGKTLIKVKDNGIGISLSDLPNIYIPGLPVKKSLSGEMHFGKGFFTTLNRNFTEVHVATSAGSFVGEILLERSGDQFRIAENSYPDVHQIPFTTITLGKPKENNPNDPIKIKANLAYYAQNYPGLSIFFNDKPLEMLRSSMLSGEPVAVHELSDDQKIKIYICEKSGVFHNGRLMSSNIDKYFWGLPSNIHTMRSRMNKTFSINFVGQFARTQGKVDFLDSAKLLPVVQILLSKTIEKQILRDGLHNPNLWKHLLPEDYYYSFMPGDCPNICHIPLRPTTNDSLVSLKSTIKAFLYENKIIDAGGKYNGQAYLAKDALKALIPDPEFRNVLEIFENAIRERINITKAQQQQFGPSDDAKEDFPVAEYAEHKVPDISPEVLKEFENICQGFASRVLGKKVRITFYNKADSSAAHASQGQKAQRIVEVGYNLKGDCIRNFNMMWNSKKWDNGVLIRIIETLTHELVHTQESLRQCTHNKRFYEEQAQLLQNFFPLIDDYMNQLRANFTL